MEQEQRRTSPTKGDRGWTLEIPNLHFCFPPKHYPDGVGNGSVWRCYCGIVWLACGQQVIKYGIGVSNEDAIFGPEKWKFYEYRDATRNVTRIAEPEVQEPYYDFRPMPQYFVKLFRELIDCNGGDWRDFSD